MFWALAQSDEPREGMRAFMEKRPPSWIPPGMPPRCIRWRPGPAQGRQAPAAAGQPAVAIQASMTGAGSSTSGPAK